MVLGIRSKSSRKSVSIQVHYTIHVLEIKPWPPSQSLRSVQSVLLQWENGDQNTGSLASTVSHGKIEFHEPFRLSLLLCRESSKIGKKRESFQKNCLEFHLYDRTAKSQLLGSATINLAEFGIIKDPKAITIQLNCKRSFRSSTQPLLYVNIQPFDIECSSSSPHSNLSKELSLDNEESESVSQSHRDGDDDDDDDIRIASFTDDDSDGSSSNILQTIRSSSKNTGDSVEISKGETKGSSGEFILPSESTTSNLHGYRKAEASTRVNDIKSPSSPTVLGSGVGNASYGRPFSPKISEESVKVAESHSEIQESIRQSRVQNSTNGDMFKSISPASPISARTKPRLEISSESQVTPEDIMSQEDRKEDQSYKKDCPKKVSGVSSIGVREDTVKMDERRKGREQITMRNEILENVLDNNVPDSESTRQGKFNCDTLLLNKKSQKHPMMNGKAEDMSVKPLQSTESESYRQFTRNRTLDQAHKIDTFNGVLDNNVPDSESTRQGKFNCDTLLLNKKSQKHQVMNGKAEDMSVKPLQSTESESYRQFTRNRTLDQAHKIDTLNGVLDNNVPDSESTRHGKFNCDTLLLNKKSQKHPMMNGKAEDVSVKFPLQSTESESYRQFTRNRTLDQAHKIDTLNGVHVGAACHETSNVNGSILNHNTKLKAEVESIPEESREAAALKASMNSVIAEHGSLKTEVERLREELREAAALEASMYSVIAEHGSSNKVHAPARRLSRFYFNACRVGSPAKIASAAQSIVSGFVLVSKACGNDVPRLTFWFSNLILLRSIVSKGVEKIHLGDDGPYIDGEKNVSGSHLHDEKENTEEHFHSWQDLETFLTALEKVEAWIFSRIVESVWWQTLTPYMQSSAAKSSSSRRIYGKKHLTGDQDQGNFSIDLWKRAFKDSCERLCPLRAGRLECGCLPLISRMVMEQLVKRLDVAMFNAILRESDEEMPTDPISDPISDSMVLPIPAGKSGFGAGAQLKNAVGDWSRWLSDLFGIDDCDTHEDNNESDAPTYKTTLKPFHLLNALSDLMMLPSDMLADGSMRKEVCPTFGISLIRRVIDNFVPDEFSPGPIPNDVLEALNNEDIQDDEGSITSFPCGAGSTLYAPPPASSVVGMLQEVGTKSLVKSGSLVVKKLYTSDDELDELDSPLSVIGMDDPKNEFAVVKGDRKLVRYELLRQVWKSSE